MPTPAALTPHMCRRCRGTAQPGRHYCAECYTYESAAVAEFRAYMAAPGCGHLGSQEIANWRQVERMIEEDNREQQ